jgi:hypothetical protein
MKKVLFVLMTIVVITTSCKNSENVEATTEVDSTAVEVIDSTEIETVDSVEVEVEAIK